MSVFKEKKIVILAGEGESTRILYHFLKHDFTITAVVLEEALPRSLFLKKRIKKLGIATVAGQLLFQLTVQPWLRRTAQARAFTIKRLYEMDSTPIKTEKIIRVVSVNSDQAREQLRSLAPDVVILSGTRIVSRETIRSISARFVNIHAGITPLFRGVHGGYWALTEGRLDACGVTVHEVDTGIDTGSILDQGLIAPGPDDNFTTYPLLQLAVGLGLLKLVLQTILQGERVDPKPTPLGISRLWSHPTFFQYLGNRFRVGVK